MRKITLLLTFIGMIGLQSCTVNENNDTVDNDTISEVFEYNNNVNFTLANDYNVILDFPHPIYSSDMVLLYRLSGVFNGEDVWKLTPETYYFDDGTLDFGYDFDFTRYDVSVKMHGFDLAGISTQFRNNQVFRVVIVPGYLSNRSSNTVDLSDYNAVIKAYNIDDSKVIVLK